MSGEGGLRRRKGSPQAGGSGRKERPSAAAPGAAAAGEVSDSGVGVESDTTTSASEGQGPAAVVVSGPESPGGGGGGSEAGSAEPLGSLPRDPSSAVAELEALGGDLDSLLAEEELAALERLFRRLFDLPDATLLRAYSCSIERNVEWSGRLFLSTDYVCFHARLFNKHILLKLRVDEVVSVKIKRRFRLFTPSVRVVLADGRTFFFRHFEHTAEAAEALRSLCGCADNGLTELGQARATLMPVSPDPSSAASGADSAASAESGVRRTRSTVDMVLLAGPEQQRFLVEERHRSQRRLYEELSAVRNTDAASAVRDICNESEAPTSEPPSAAPSEANSPRSAGPSPRVAAAAPARPAPGAATDHRRARAAKDAFEKMFSDVQMVKIHEFELGVRAKTFFDIFFGSGAIFSFEAFHKHQGNWDVELGRWQTCDLLGATRQLRFMAAIVGAPPWVSKTTPVFKVQRHCFVGASTLLLDVDTVTRDVPYGTSFHTLEKWVVEDVPNGGCRVVVSQGVRFVKRIKVPGVKAVVRSRSALECKAAIDSWLAMARQTVDDVRAGRLDIVSHTFVCDALHRISEDEDEKAAAPGGGGAPSAWLPPPSPARRRRRRSSGASAASAASAAAAAAAEEASAAEAAGTAAEPAGPQRPSWAADPKGSTAGGGSACPSLSPAGTAAAVLALLVFALLVMVAQLRERVTVLEYRASLFESHLSGGAGGGRGWPGADPAPQ